MNSIIPIELLVNIIWKYLSCKDIKSMCTTSTHLYKIYTSPDTWIYLLDRDYDVQDEIDDPMDEYKRLHRRDRIYNRIRPNISDHIRNNYSDIPIETYHNIKDAILELGGQDIYDEMIEMLNDTQDYTKYSYSPTMTFMEIYHSEMDNIMYHYLALVVAEKESKNDDQHKHRQ